MCHVKKLGWNHWHELSFFPLGKGSVAAPGLEQTYAQEHSDSSGNSVGSRCPRGKQGSAYGSPYVKWWQVSIHLRGKHSQGCHLGAYGHWERRKRPLTCQVLNACCQKIYILFMTAFNLWGRLKRHLFLQATGRTIQFHSISCNNYIQAKCLAVQEGGCSMLLKIWTPNYNLGKQTLSSREPNRKNGQKVRTNTSQKR